MLHYLICPWLDSTCDYILAELRVYQFPQASFLDRYHVHKLRLCVF